MNGPGSSDGAPVDEGPDFRDGKADGAMRTIGEVSAAFGIKPHVLRYWESKFPMLTPLKRSGGRRLYRAEDIAMVERIDRLVNREGYTLAGARKAIKGKSKVSGKSDDKAEPTAAPVARANETERTDLEAIARQLRAIRDRLSAALQN